MLVEVGRKSFLASLVPVIVNSILNEHQIIVDIVAFVPKGVFPRSRLGEKQRGKILAGWVSRKMSTIAQWAIKDMDAASVAGTEGPADNSAAAVAAANELNRASMASSHRSSGGGTTLPGGPSSLRNMERAAQIPEQRELEHAFDNGKFGGGAGMASGLMIAEMPADLPLAVDDGSETTPTRSRMDVNQSVQHSSYELPDFGSFHIGDQPYRPGGGGVSVGAADPGQRQQSSGAPQLRLPGVDGRESMDWDDLGGGGGGGGGRLGVVNAYGNEADDDEWRNDAIMHMNLAGNLQRREG